MAHNVEFVLPQRDLGKVDIEFIITKDNVQLGKMKISKGGVDYYPKNAKKPIKKKLESVGRHVSKMMAFPTLIVDFVIASR